MKLAVISDIHGNYKALEAFLAYLDTNPVDGIICLGDYVTDSPYPERTMALIYQMREKYRCYMIRGNRENYLLNNAKESQGWKPSSSNGALYYTALHLSETDMQFFADLPEEGEVLVQGCASIAICHGTPGHVRGNVTIGEGIREKALEAVPHQYLFGGHSHHQEVFHYNGKTYLNPGSLGLAIDGVGRRALFAVVISADNIMETTEIENAKAMPDDIVKRAAEAAIGVSKDSEAGWDIQLKSIPYDVDSFLQDFTESGLDEYGMVLNRAVKKTLVTGVNYFYKSVVEAQKEANCPLHEIPESIWQKVAERLEL